MNIIKHNQLIGTIKGGGLRTTSIMLASPRITNLASNYTIIRHQHRYAVSPTPRLPITYLFLAGVSFTSCFLLSWYTFVDRSGSLVINNNEEHSHHQLLLFSLRSQRQSSLNNNDKIQHETSKEIPPPSDAFLSNLFEQRKNHVESICRRRYPKQRITHPQMLLNRIGKPFNKRLPSNLYVSQPLKIVFCSIPKVASSNWFSYFDKLSRNSTFTGLKDVNFNETTPVLRSITSFAAEEAKTILESYKKIMWVREPLQRLVSAWRDKLSVYNPYYSKVVGSVVIKSYRPNATTAEITAGYPTSLEEFLNYLKYQQRTRYDVHWRPYYFACSPCNLPLMQFDYIGHLESINVEADFILRQLTNRDDYPPFPSPYHNRTSYAVLQEYISKVPKNLVEQVLRNFYIDYELYGYTVPTL